MSPWKKGLAITGFVFCLSCLLWGIGEQVNGVGTHASAVPPTLDPKEPVAFVPRIAATNGKATLRDHTGSSGALLAPKLDLKISGVGSPPGMIDPGIGISFPEGGLGSSPAGLPGRGLPGTRPDLSSTEDLIPRLDPPEKALQPLTPKLNTKGNLGKALSLPPKGSV